MLYSYIRSEPHLSYLHQQAHRTVLIKRSCHPDIEPYSRPDPLPHSTGTSGTPPTSLSSGLLFWDNPRSERSSTLSFPILHHQYGVRSSGRSPRYHFELDIVWFHYCMFVHLIGWSSYLCDGIFVCINIASLMNVTPQQPSQINLYREVLYYKQFSKKRKKKTILCTPQTMLPFLSHTSMSSSSLCFEELSLHVHQHIFKLVYLFAR